MDQSIKLLEMELGYVNHKLSNNTKDSVPSTAFLMIKKRDLDKAINALKALNDLCITLNKQN